MSPFTRIIFLTSVMRRASATARIRWRLDETDTSYPEERSGVLTKNAFSCGARHTRRQFQLRA